MISYSDVLQGIAVFLRFITDLRCWERKRRFGTIVNNQFNQARRQDLAAGGPKTRRRGQKPEGAATFLKYSIGCMQQPVGQT